MVLPPTHVKFPELVHNKSDDSVGEFNSGDNELELGEANPPKIGVTRGLTSLG